MSPYNQLFHCKMPVCSGIWFCPVLWMCCNMKFLNLDFCFLCSLKVFVSNSLKSILHCISQWILSKAFVVIYYNLSICKKSKFQFGKTVYVSCFRESCYNGTSILRKMWPCWKSMQVSACKNMGRNKELKLVCVTAWDELIVFV